MSTLSADSLDMEDLIDFQRAFQMQSKIEGSPSLRGGDAEKLLRKVHIDVDDLKKKRQVEAAKSNLLEVPGNEEGAGASGSGGVRRSSSVFYNRVDFLDLLGDMSRSIVDDPSTDDEIKTAFKVLGRSFDSDGTATPDEKSELSFEDFKRAYKAMGDDFSQVIAIEEVHEIFDHFQLKRRNSHYKDKKTEEVADQAKLKLDDFINTVNTGV